MAAEQEEQAVLGQEAVEFLPVLLMKCFFHYVVASIQSKLIQDL